MRRSISGLTYAQYCEAIYIAYFGRAGDGGGMMFWEERRRDAGATGLSIATVSRHAVKN